MQSLEDKVDEVLHKMVSSARRMQRFYEDDEDTAEFLIKKSGLDIQLTLQDFILDLCFVPADTTTDKAVSENDAYCRDGFFDLFTSRRSELEIISEIYKLKCRNEVACQKII